jgi:uncharacterized protein (TIGR03083 family)
MSQEKLSGIDPFEILDAEAARLDRYFSSLDEAGWQRLSRCAGWSVRDVLAHLSGEEMYNHACLNDDLAGFFALLKREGVGDDGFGRFNEWCVQARSGLPVDEVLAEWRAASSQTRSRMRQLGQDGSLATSAGPYPAGLQAFHYASEYATHADDVGAEIPAGEAARRTRWRALFGEFALVEQHRPVTVEMRDDRVRVSCGDDTADLAQQDFVAATVGRLPAGAPLPLRLREALCCLA